MCLNCYKPGYRRSDCQNERAEWMDYVCNFIETNNFEKEMYGRWFDIGRKHMRAKKKQNDERRVAENNRSMKNQDEDISKNN